MISLLLLKDLNENNVLVKVFRSARDRYVENNIIQLTLQLFYDRGLDGRTYNMPTCNEVAALIVGDFEQEFSHRDIIIEYKSRGLKRISELHPSYMALQYSLFFPYGEDGYHTNIK